MEEKPEDFILMKLIRLEDGIKMAEIKGHILEPGMTYCYVFFGTGYEIRISWPIKDNV